MTKHLYISGWEAHFNGDRECMDLIATQITDQKTAESTGNAIELVFENDKLVQAWDYEDGARKERPLRPDELGLPWPDLAPRSFLQLEENPNGRHQLGGEIPEDFRLPDNNCVVPFQYLGYINNTAPDFGWLPFPVHLTAPIYLNFYELFLDYTDPLHPKIINREDMEDTDTSYEEDLNQDSEIVFEALKFDFVRAHDFTVMGNAGIPHWIQGPRIPVCPKSGKTMRFLCQFFGGVPALRTNVEAHNEFFRQYYEELNFWGDGDLFVFFEPESKTACYFIQNT
jgi:hypothetical protein